MSSWKKRWWAGEGVQQILTKCRNVSKILMRIGETREKERERERWKREGRQELCMKYVQGQRGCVCMCVYMSVRVCLYVRVRAYYCMCVYLKCVSYRNCQSLLTFLAV